MFFSSLRRTNSIEKSSRTLEYFTNLNLVLRRNDSLKVGFNGANCLLEAWDDDEEEGDEEERNNKWSLKGWLRLHCWALDGPLPNNFLSFGAGRSSPARPCVALIRAKKSNTNPPSCQFCWHSRWPPPLPQNHEIQNFSCSLWCRSRRVWQWRYR